MPGEYHRFATEEVDAQSLSDRSSDDEIEDLERAESEATSLNSKQSSRLIFHSLSWTQALFTTYLTLNKKLEYRIEW